jgi:hypothetical protein
MTTDAAKIRLIRLDSDNLLFDDDVEEAVRFSIELSEPPTDEWAQSFLQAYKNLPYPVKPPIALDGNKFWISYLPQYGAELQAYLKFLKSLVDSTNNELLFSAQISENHHKHTHIKEFRDLLKTVHLPSLEN